MKRSNLKRIVIAIMITAITSTSFAFAENTEDLNTEILNINQSKVQEDSGDLISPISELYIEPEIKEDFEAEGNLETEEDFENKEVFPIPEEDAPSNSQLPVDDSNWDDFSGFTNFEGSLDDIYAGSGNFNNIDVYPDDFDYIDISNEQGAVQKDNFIAPKQTFQYNLSLEDKYPIFIDTGIFYKEGVPLKLENLQEIIRQISVRAEAKLISDENRFIILANDEFAVLDGNSKDVETLISAFRKIGVTLKVQSSRIGQKFNLADYLESKENLSIEMDGKEVELITEPEIYDSRVLLPIKSIGEGLGGRVTWNKKTETVTIKKDKITIEVQANKNIVKINRKEYLINKKAEINKDNERMLSLINLIVTKLGGEMVWDSTNDILKITTLKTVPIDDDY